jgi:hypothetical protein
MGFEISHLRGISADYSGEMVVYLQGGSNHNGTIIITDRVADRDGTDTLINVRYVQFADGTTDLQDGSPWQHHHDHGSPR